MSWRSHGRGPSAWRQCLAPLRQEASAKGVVPRACLQVALDALKAAEGEAQDHELAEDLPFLVQQLLGPPVSVGAAQSETTSRDVTGHVKLCRLLSTVAASRNIRLQPPAANLVLGALRRWADVSHDDGYASNTSTAAAGAPGPVNAPLSPAAAAAAGAPTSSLALEALTALAALLPDHLGLLSEHERAAQLAALQSLLTPPPPPPPRDAGSARPLRPADTLELQTLALTALAACCSRASTSTPAYTANVRDRDRDSGREAAAAAGLTADEASALLSALASLLHACACRARPVEDAAHSRLYAALLRALHAAIGEGRQAWVARAATLVEGLQRLLTYGAQASAASGASAAAAAAPKASGHAAVAGPAGSGAGGGEGAGVGSGGGGGRYRPPHLRQRERTVDGGGSYSDSDVSDTEHAGAGAGGAGGGGGGAAVDRFRSSRVRLGALSCIQAMAKSDPRAMHAHWMALLPLQAPLQKRPLSPHLLTVLLHDPLVKVRALAASTIAVLLDGPAQRSILAVAEAKSSAPGSRPPVRGFLTLSLSLGQLLLGAHAGLLAAAAGEASGVVLPGVLRALVALIAASPYERLPPELLPETIKVLRTRWAALSAAPSAAAAGELAPIQAAYLACLAECFATKQPTPGLAAYLRQGNTATAPTHPHSSAGATGAASPRAGAVGAGGVTASSGASDVNGASSAGGGCGGGCGGGGGPQDLVGHLLELASDPAAAAVLRIEALAALKGIAAHYTFAMPDDAWSALRTAAEVGLTSHPASRAPVYPRSPSGPPSRSSSSSSLNINLNPGPTRGSSSVPSGDRSAPSSSWRNATQTPATSSSAEQSGSTGASGISPDDKAAQLSVKLVSEYLAAVARQYGLSRVDAAGGEADGAPGGGAGPPPSPRVVSLAAAVPRPSQQQQHQAVLSPVSAASEEEVAAGLQRLAGMWRDAVELLVPAATSHTSYMVRSAGLGCLGEVPDPVFALLEPPLQRHLLALLSAAAATDAVAAVRAAGCRALGAAAAFPPVLDHPALSGQVSGALGGCLRDSVMSVRISAGWAVANLCDAHRRRLADGAAGRAQQPRDEHVKSHLSRLGESEAAQRVESHCHASTSAPGRGAAHNGMLAEAEADVHGRPPPPPLEPHHYRQLAALCEAAIAATQDADKVRANGIRAVGNLLAALSPDMAPGLAATAGGAGSDTAPPPALVADPPTGFRPQGWAARGGAAGAASARQPSRSALLEPQATLHSGQDSATGGSGGGSGGAVQLDAWLDSALSCLQSTLTTGGMKVQWNACYALLGLLRNSRLLVHPRVAGRTAPLLLLLVMLVRDSANFKIRTHAAAALAALPSREAYGDVLPDALLVVASALEGLSNGGGAAAAAGTAPGGGKAADAADAEDGDGADGRIPNYRYAAGLSTQLRATLLHLLSLAQPADARRVREALARRAEFLHACLREQLAEAVLPLRTLLITIGGGGGGGGSFGGVSGGGCQQVTDRASWSSLRGEAAGGTGSGGFGGAELELPADPFGLSGSGASRSASPRDTAASRALATLLEGLSLGNGEDARMGSGVNWSVPVEGAATGVEARRAARGSAAESAGIQAGGASRGGAEAQPSSLTVKVHAPEMDFRAELQHARSQVASLGAPLRGFAGLLSQLGAGCEPVLRDVQHALELMPTPERNGL